MAHLQKGVERSSLCRKIELFEFRRLYLCEIRSSRLKKVQTREERKAQGRSCLLKQEGKKVSFESFRKRKSLDQTGETQK